MLKKRNTNCTLSINPPERNRSRRFGSELIHHVSRQLWVSDETEIREFHVYQCLIPTVVPFSRSNGSLGAMSPPIAFTPLSSSLMFERVLAETELSKSSF